jgi:hypothetical protein
MMYYEYKVEKAPCSSTQHIVEWLNVLGSEGWQMVGRVMNNSRRRNSDEGGPTFYFCRLREENNYGSILYESIHG